MLKQRIVTALILVAVLLAALFYASAWQWLLLAAAICGGGAWEWGGLMAWRPSARAAAAAVFALLCLGIGVACGLHVAVPSTSVPLLMLYVLSAAFWLAVVPLWLKRKGRIDARPLLALLVGAVVLLPPALALAHLRQLGAGVLLGVLSLVWIADIAAYFTGRAFGRHKLAPAISPGKTWEGAFGAVLGVVVGGLSLLAGVATGVAVPSAAWWLVLLFLVVLTAISIEGDLLESLLKRQAGVKDSGTLLPGHGGILDRIDSLTATLPLAALVVLIAMQYFSHV